MLKDESISFPTFNFFRAKSLKVWCDENGLILTCKITTDLRKMASIRWSFFKSKCSDIQIVIKQNSHLRVTCRLGVLITSKKGVFLRLKAQKNKARKKRVKAVPLQIVLQVVNLQFPQIHGSCTRCLKNGYQK